MCGCRRARASQHRCSPPTGSSCHSSDRHSGLVAAASLQGQTAGAEGQPSLATEMQAELQHMYRPCCKNVAVFYPLQGQPGTEGQQLTPTMQAQLQHMQLLAQLQQQHQQHQQAVAAGAPTPQQPQQQQQPVEAASALAMVGHAIDAGCHALAAGPQQPNKSWRSSGIRTLACLVHLSRLPTSIAGTPALAQATPLQQMAQCSGSTRRSRSQLNTR